MFMVNLPGPPCVVIAMLSNSSQDVDRLEQDAQLHERLKVGQHDEPEFLPARGAVDAARLRGSSLECLHAGEHDDRANGAQRHTTMMIDRLHGVLGEPVDARPAERCDAPVDDAEDGFSIMFFQARA
jgi:hypothetical protein